MSEDTVRMKLRKGIFYTVIFFFVFGLFCVWYANTAGNSSTKGELTAHGWVEGTEITLSSKVMGRLIKLPIEEGDDRKSGELIAQVDSNQILSRLDAAKAQINNAKKMLIRSEANVAIFENKVQGASIALDITKKKSAAQINEASAAFNSIVERLKQVKYNFEKASKDHTRFLSLYKKEKISQSKMDSVEERYKITKTEVERVQRGLERGKANLDLANTSLFEIVLKKNELETYKRELKGAVVDIDIAKTVLEIATANKNEVKSVFDDTFVYNPVNGTVIEKMAEIGEHVVPGTPLVVMIDMGQLYIKTYVEQVDVGKIKLNDSAKIYVDSFPNRFFEGKIIFISPKAEFTPRDIQMDEHRSKIVYKIKVAVNNSEGFIKPGMPADIKLKIG